MMELEALNELADVLARTEFCKDCNRLMELTSRSSDGIPVEWDCHYCNQRWTTQAPEPKGVQE